MQRRPTEEQTARYLTEWGTSGSARKYAAMSSDVEAVLRDVHIVGAFLGECLMEMNLPQATREDICFQFGRMCFGRTDLWEVFDRVYPQAVELAESLALRKDWAGIPVPQEVPAPTVLLTSFLLFARRSVGEEGVYPLPYLRQAAGGDVTVEALAVNGGEALTHVVEQLRKNPPTEFVFGIDMTAAPDQGIEFQDFLAVIWYVGGQFLSGVINYEREGVSEIPAFREIDWNNNYWNHGIREQFISLMQAVLA